MSTRVIASIGVVLCLAMTSFSIYLGVAEHSYTRGHGHSIAAVSSEGAHQLKCMAMLPGTPAVSSVGRAASALGPCASFVGG